MTFEPGDHVHIANFGKGVVREVRNGGRYLVELKGRAMVVMESQVSAVDGPKRRRPPLSPPGVDCSSTLARSHAASSIDLHGMTAEVAIAAVDTFLDAALLAGRAEVRIIHGRSGGRLRRAVHERLRELPPVRSFRLDEANPGVTIVVL